MIGPFATYDEARAAAKPGEVIMARDARLYRGEAWCVMADLEATLAIHTWLEPWVHWEDVKEQA